MVPLAAAPSVHPRVQAEACGLCRDLLAVAHALPCGHKFCFECISDWQSAQIKMSVPLSCPVDGKEVCVCVWGGGGERAHALVRARAKCGVRAVPCPSSEVAAARLADEVLSADGWIAYVSRAVCISSAPRSFGHSDCVTGE